MASFYVVFFREWMKKQILICAKITLIKKVGYLFPQYYYNMIYKSRYGAQKTT